jgi:hypothetical protein
MIYVLLRDGNLIEVFEAETALKEGDEVVCRDAEGNPVVFFPANTVSLYGNHEAMEQYRDEQPH